jgi:hypothetical protein
MARGCLAVLLAGILLPVAPVALADDACPGAVEPDAVLGDPHGGEGHDDCRAASAVVAAAGLAVAALLGGGLLARRRLAAVAGAG